MTCGGSISSLILPFSCQSKAMAFSPQNSISVDSFFYLGNSSATTSISHNLSIVSRNPRLMVENFGVSHMLNRVFWYVSRFSHFSKYFESPLIPSLSVTLSKGQILAFFFLYVAAEMSARHNTECLPKKISPEVPPASSSPIFLFASLATEFLHILYLKPCKNYII